MIPLDNPQKHLDNFKKAALNPSLLTKEGFRSVYYRALLLDPHLRHVKNAALKGDYKRVSTLLATAQQKLLAKTEKELEDSLNLTLRNLIQYHLDSYMGKENNEKNLESIEREINEIMNGVFNNDLPFKLTVEDTTSEGTNFRITITPISLLF